MIDLAHESIMRVWNRLQTWVTEEQQASELYVRLSESAGRHAHGQQSLWRNPELAVGMQWLAANGPNAAWASRYKPGFEQAVTFLHQSRQSEKKQRVLLWASLAAAVLIVLTAIGLYALLKRAENVRLEATNQKLTETTVRQQNEVNVLRERLARQQGQASEPAPAPPRPLPVQATTPTPHHVATPGQSPLPASIENGSSPPQALPPQTNSLQAEMLSAHNAIRQKLGLPDLQWSSELAAKAQKWADTLAATGQLKAEGILGQNVGYTEPPLTGTFMVVKAWADGVRNYDYEKDTCIDPNLKCRSYVQIVWRATKYVGCGASHDAVRDFWVCDYDPPGNVAGVRPY